MLKHNKKYTFRFGTKKIVFNQNYNEPDFHVYAKALVYALFHKQYPTIRVEANVDERFNPDLSASSFDGTMIFWAECGNVSMDKLEKLFKKYRQAHFVFVKKEKDIAIFEKHLQKRAKDIHSLPLIDIIIYPEHFEEWWVSEEGDVYLPKDEVNIIHFHDPQKRVKYY